MEAQAATSFDPGRYLTRVNGSEYLEVKWRLVWLRDLHPNAAVDTELVHQDDRLAIFRARVTLPDGGSATGWGSESPDDFRDYIEKAETKAVGRALAALGFGTQFCPDFDFGAAVGKVVDSPIDFASTRGRRAGTGQAADADRGGRQVASVNQVATGRQVAFLQAVARAAGLDEAGLDEEARRGFGRPVVELSRRDASALIERLQARRGEADLAS